MKVKDLILKEIEKFPDEYLSEVLDFIRFLEEKNRGKDRCCCRERIFFR